MAVATKIRGFGYLPGDRKPSEETMAAARGFARQMKGLFDFTAYDAALDHDVNIKVWGTRPDGYKLEILVVWDGLIDIHIYAADWMTGITNLTISQAQHHLYKMTMPCS